MQKVLGVKLFKARYFERGIYLKSTQLKQNQNKVNSAKFDENIHIQPILFKWVGLLVLVLKAYHKEDLYLKNVQSLITKFDWTFKVWLRRYILWECFDYIILGFLTH